MKNKLIIFDCFGVIFDEIAPVFFERYLPSDQATIIKDRIFVPADLGQIPYEQIFEEMSAVLNMDKAAVISEWESLIRLKDEMVPIIKEAGNSADIALLSNAPLGFVERLFEEHNLNGLFDRICISCNVKMAKPDPEIYRYCVSQFNKQYDKIYMIDDNIKNLEHLPELGITPVHFRNAGSLIKELDL